MYYPKGRKSHCLQLYPFQNRTSTGRKLRTMIKTPLQITTIHTHLETFHLLPFLFQNDKLKHKFNLGLSETLLIISITLGQNNSRLHRLSGNKKAVQSIEKLRQMLTLQCISFLMFQMTSF